MPALPSGIPRFDSEISKMKITSLFFITITGLSILLNVALIAKSRSENGRLNSFVQAISQAYSYIFRQLDTPAYAKPAAREAQDFLSLQLVGTAYAADLQHFIKLEYVNPDLLEGEQLAKATYNSLWGNQDFLNFGSSKIFIVTAHNSENTFNYHPNILVTNDTTLAQYLDIIKDKVNVEQYGYDSSTITSLTILVWNADLLRNRRIKITRDATAGLTAATGGLRFNSSANAPAVGQKVRSYSTQAIATMPLGQHNDKAPVHAGLRQPDATAYAIKPLARRAKVGKPFFTIDIETVSINGQQMPVLIGLATGAGPAYAVEQLTIDKDLLNINVDLAVKDLWTRFAGRLVQLAQQFNVRTIFAHNLGSFDGYFIYKGLLSLAYAGEHVSCAACAMDDKNKFIYITYGSLGYPSVALTFIDSARIFPVSLEELCKLFNVAGKSGSYQSEHNQISVLATRK